MVTRGQTLQTDGELDVAGADDVLDLKVRELGIEAKLLDDARVLAGGQLGVVLGLGTGDNHLARGEDQGGGLGLTNTHDNGRETLWSDKKVQPLHLITQPTSGKIPLGCTRRCERAAQ